MGGAALSSPWFGYKWPSCLRAGLQGRSQATRSQAASAGPGGRGSGADESLCALTANVGLSISALRPSPALGGEGPCLNVELESTLPVGLCPHRIFPGAHSLTVGTRGQTACSPGVSSSCPVWPGINPPPPRWALLWTGPSSEDWGGVSSASLWARYSGNAFSYIHCLVEPAQGQKIG